MNNQQFNEGFSASLYEGLIVLILVGPLMMVMFAMLVYMVINQCYSLVHVLPDNIMRWIGGPQQQDTTAQLAHQLMGGAKGSGEGLARSMHGGKEGGKESGGKAKGKTGGSSGGGGGSNTTASSGANVADKGGKKKP